MHPAHYLRPHDLLSVKHIPDRYTHFIHRDQTVKFQHCLSCRYNDIVPGNLPEHKFFVNPHLYRPCFLITIQKAPGKTRGRFTILFCNLFCNLESTCDRCCLIISTKCYYRHHITSRLCRRSCCAGIDLPFACES